MRRTARKLFQISFILVFSLLFVVFCTAHKGNTDNNGGHFDTFTGEYHYHHGYPAHDHENGICPYDYHDKTNHSQGAVGNKSDGTIKINTEQKTSDDEKISTAEKIIIIVVCAIVLIAAFPIFIFPIGCVACIPLIHIQKLILKKIGNEKYRKMAQIILQVISGIILLAFMSFLSLGLFMG